MGERLLEHSWDNLNSTVATFCSLHSDSTAVMRQACSRIRDLKPTESKLPSIVSVRRLCSYESEVWLVFTFCSVFAYMVLLQDRICGSSSYLKKSTNQAVHLKMSG
jgi:hypothetical protein